MNFIKNISTKAKLVSLTFILISGVFLYAMWHVYQKYSLYQEMDRLEKVVVLSTKISALVHETQKERGATAGYLGSKGKKFGDILKNQRVNTDSKLEILNTYLSTFDKSKYSSKFNALLNSAMTNISNINKVRSKVNTFEISGKDAIGFYTNKINAIYLDTIASISTMSTDANSTRDINSYTNFLYAKERAGIERAVLSNTFGADKFKEGMYKKFIKLVTEQGSFTKSFQVTASNDWQSNFTNTLKGPAVDETQKLRDIAFSKANIGGFNVDAVYWFKTITKKINLLKKIENYQSNALITSMKEKSSSAWNMFLVILVSFFVPAIFAMGITLFIVRHITTSLKNIEMGIDSFFKFLNRQSSTSDAIQINSTDEFGNIAHIINTNISNTKKAINQDNQVVDEIIDLVEKAENGFYTYKSTIKANSPELEKLRINFNKMLNATNTNLNHVKESLIAYGSNDFTHKTVSNGISGNIGTLITSTQALGDNVSGLLAVINNASVHLKTNTGILSKSTEELSTSSNEQAASLEETAASIEEITSNIRANSEKAAEMLDLSTQTSKSAQDGQALATSTANAMNEIESSAKEIANAITAIDQIAFQTNILSLNAAVEAATAGEAGKGFAVVAGEVRNLAARSAETAKLIKDLVDKALSKSNEGKQISTMMIDGYNELNDKVQTTSILINDVANASKEQMAGIDQINSAIMQLDQMTQENTKVANSVTGMTTEVEEMSEKLSALVSNTKYLGGSASQVCQVDLAFDISKLKLDHVKFKDKYFTNLSDKKDITVVTHHECAMGQWIDAHKNEKIATTASWRTLLDRHANVHKGVQKYLDNNNASASNDILSQNGAQIESDTLTLFELFNNVKTEHCKILETEAAQSKVTSNTTQTKTVAPTTKPIQPIAQVTSSDNNDDEWDSF